MRRVLLSCLALLAASAAFGQSSVTGQYQLRVPEDASKVARLSGRRAASGNLTLHGTHRFTLEVNDTVRHGHYDMDGDHLTLYLDDGTMMGGILRSGVVSLGGLTFEHGLDARTARRFPTDASTGRLRRVDGVLTTGDPEPSEAPVIRVAPPIVVPIAPPVAVFTPDPVVPVVPPAVAVVPARRLLKVEDCCGAWTVRSKGVENKTQRMELKADGTFRFAMTGATSEGTWSVDGGDIVLVYTKVDGQPLEEGASGRKRIPMADDGSAFRIDTYRYEHATDK